jgi:hypothetical protein
MKSSCLVLRSGRLRFGALFVMAATLVFAVDLRAQAPSAPTSNTKPSSTAQGASMKTFAFIFRQSGPAPAAELQAKRSAEVREWAIHLRDQGHAMNPHLLGEEHFLAAPGDHEADQMVSPSVVAILFADFASFEDAKKAAQTHPGLRYGITVEVRDSTAPAFTPEPATAR